jgi:hypothetical protein
MVAVVTTEVHVMAMVVEAVWALPIMAAVLPDVLIGTPALMQAVERTTHKTEDTTAIVLPVLMQEEEEVLIRKPEPITGTVLHAPIITVTIMDGEIPMINKV